MARTRVNKKVVTITLGVAAVAVAGGGYWYKALRPKDPAKFTGAADMYIRAGDLPQATHALQMAERLRPTDPAIHLRLARLFYDQKAADPQGNVTAAVAEWTQAEELDPKSAEAWRGLLEANMLLAITIAQQSNNGLISQEAQFRLPKQFALARAAAQKLLKIDPNDATARSSIPILTINLWMMNLPIPQVTDAAGPDGAGVPPAAPLTDAQQIDRAVAELTACMRDHPGNAELPYWIAQAKISQAVRLANQNSADALSGDLKPGQDHTAAAAAADPNDPNTPPPAGGAPVVGERGTDVKSLFAEAAVVFDEPISRQPDNADLYYKKYEVLGQLIRTDQSGDSQPAYQRAQRVALESAQAHVSPADPEVYTKYKVAWAGYLAQSDPGRAEAVLKDLLAHPPAPTTAPAVAAGGGPPPVDPARMLQDINVRLSYAYMLERDQTRRADALAILASVPATVPLDLPASAQPTIADRLALVHLMRAQLLTDQLEATARPTVQSDLTRQATAEIDAAGSNSRFKDEYQILKARGRLQLVSGQIRDAIQTLQAANDRLAAAAKVTDYALVGWLAQAYDRGQQSGTAIKLLEQAVRNPIGANNPAPHAMLARLYLDEQDYDKGRQQVAWLSERYPDDVQTVQLRLRALGPNPDPKDFVPLYTRLPERSPAELAAKLNWSFWTKNVPEQQRLMYALFKTTNGDPGIAMRLASNLAADGKPGEANLVLNETIKLHPERKGTIQVSLAEINHVDAGAVVGMARDEIGKIPDPLDRHVAEFHLAHVLNDLPGQIKALEAANATQADNAEVLNDLFVCYLSDKQYDRASAMLPHLADRDVDNCHGTLFRFRLDMAQGDKMGSLNLARQLTRDYPQFASSWECLGEAQEASGQIDAACQNFLATLDHQGNNPQAMQHLVDDSIRLGKLDDARRYLADARRKFPDDPTYRDQQVRIELAYGDPTKVLAVVDDRVKQHPEQPQSWQVAAQAYNAAAEQATSKGDVDLAAKDTAVVRQLLADALVRFPEEMRFAAELADVQSQDKSDAGVAAAAATFGKIKAQPHWAASPVPDLMLGRMYLVAGRPADAVAPLRRSVDLQRDAPEPRSLLADALVAAGKPQDALAALEPAKGQLTIRAKYVDLMLAQHRGADVEAELQADLAAHPGDGQSGNLLAHVCAVEGKWDQAMAVAERTLAANPKDPSVYFVRGSILAERPQPDLEGAARDLSVFCAAFPNNLQGHMMLAGVLAGRHDPEGATQQLELAVAAAPDDKPARLRLTRAYMAASPPRTLDAQRIVTQSLAMPALAHDPDAQRVAAAVWLASPENHDRAVTSIRDAMAHTPDQRAMLDEYLGILLSTGNYALLLSESDKYVNAATPAGWDVYDYRGQARAKSGDVVGAYAEFQTAMDQAGTVSAAGPALAVANHATDLLGAQKAMDMVIPRAQNSALWKLVLTNCYQRDRQIDAALRTAEDALPMASSFAPADRRLLQRMTAALYMVTSPPRGDKALPLLKAVLRDDPNDVDAMNNVACCLTELVDPPQPKEALAYSTRAYDALARAGQMNQYVADTQGWLLILNGQVANGIDVLHRVIDTADLPDAHYHLAQGYLRMDPAQPEDAKRELNRATELLNRPADANHPVDASMMAKVPALQHQVDDLISKREAQADKDQQDKDRADKSAADKAQADKAPADKPGPTAARADPPAGPPTP